MMAGGGRHKEEQSTQKHIAHRNSHYTHTGRADEEAVRRVSGVLTGGFNNKYKQRT